MRIKSLDMTRIRGLLRYEDGVLYWTAAAHPKVAGKPAGSVKHKLGGRIAVKIDNSYFYAHRIIWALHNGDVPEGMFIDHINNDPTDNRIVNLRPATRGQNTANSRLQTRSSTNFKGVTFHKRVGRFMAQIKSEDSGYKYLGYYDTAEEAHEAYKAAAKIIHGEFRRCQ